MDEDRVRMWLAFAATAEANDELVPNNLTNELELRGLISTKHMGWGMYAVALTREGRTALENGRLPPIQRSRP